MKQNKGNDNFNLHTSVITCYVAQLIRARARERDSSEGIGSNLEFFSLFFFFVFFFCFLVFTLLLIIFC